MRWRRIGTTVVKKKNHWSCLLHLQSLKQSSVLLDRSNWEEKQRGPQILRKVSPIAAPSILRSGRRATTGIILDGLAKPHHTQEVDSINSAIASQRGNYHFTTFILTIHSKYSGHTVPHHGVSMVFSIMRPEVHIQLRPFGRGVPVGRVWTHPNRRH